MYLSFVPLTVDGRFSAKEIVENKKKLTQWQDKFWEHNGAEISRPGKWGKCQPDRT